MPPAPETPSFPVSGGNTPRTKRRALLGPPKVSWGGPRALVLFVLATVVIIGGGRRWLRSLRSKRLADRLAEPDVTRDEILAASEAGREGLFELFRLLSPETDAPRRQAAGEALARLWKRDQLVAEEEKGIVTRGFVVQWHARRRYPRRMTAPISITVDFHVPFLGASPLGIQQRDLEWSYRLKGTERLSLESFSPWSPGPGHLEFTVNPDDFQGNGPHRLIFQAKVRPNGLTSSWELDLPQSSMSFDFDPALHVDSIQTQHDAGREAAIGAAVTLESAPEDGGEPFPMNQEFALRSVPRIRVAGPLPCDLAHQIALEIDGVAGSFPRGNFVAVASGEGPSGPRIFPLDHRPLVPEEAIERPGIHRMRAVLTASPSLGWANPDVRSLWPGTVVTDWTEVKIVRR